MERSDRSSSRSWQRGSYRGRRRKKRRKPWSERLADWTRGFIAFLFSNVGIICLVVGYTIAGAVLFAHIEGKNSSQTIINVISTKNHVVTELWEFTTRENIFSEENWKSKVSATLEELQRKIVEAVKDGYEGEGLDELQNGSSQWSYAGAFLYSLTVITTIGYGNTCPRTKWGKLATIVYAIVGMPLFLLYLSNIGDILARSFKWTYARFCLCRCRRRPRNAMQASQSAGNFDNPREHWQMVRIHSNELDTSSLDQHSMEGDAEDQIEDDADEGEDEEEEDDSEDEYDPQTVTVPLTLCLTIMVGYICGGTLLFTNWENWDFLDGSYFCFISLSTIGFGDIVPGVSLSSEQKGTELSFVFCSMYLMLGMALIAMCFNLMQEEVIAKMRSLVRTVKHIFRCDR